jgi:hypothetical protein
MMPKEIKGRDAMEDDLVEQEDIKLVEQTNLYP